MRFKVQVGMVALTMTIALGFRPMPFRGTNDLLDRSQYWNQFYYDWVNPGFLRPVREWQTPREYLWPSLTFEEASEWLGRPVRCAYRSETISGRCKIGEPGRVANIEKVPDGGYFVVVQWEKHPQDEPCYYGRYSSRIFLLRE
jgi:hypothetical protein